MSKEMKAATRIALRASSRANVRPLPKPYSSDVERTYRIQVRQVEEMLGLHPPKREGVLGEFLGCLGGLLGFGLGLTILFYMLSRI